MSTNFISFAEKKNVRCLAGLGNFLAGAALVLISVRQVLLPGKDRRAKPLLPGKPKLADRTYG